MPALLARIWHDLSHETDGPDTVAVGGRSCIVSGHERSPAAGELISGHAMAATDVDSPSARLQQPQLPERGKGAHVISVIAAKVSYRIVNAGVAMVP